MDDLRSPQDQRHRRCSSGSLRFLEVELGNDNVEAFGTRWDETIIAMTKKPDDELLKNLYFRQLETADQLKQLLVLYIQDIF